MTLKTDLAPEPRILPGGDTVDMNSPASTNYDGYSSNEEQYVLPGKNPTANIAGNKRSRTITGRMLVLTAACSLGFFTFGYHCIVLNGPGAVIEAWMNASYAQRGYAQHTTRTVPGISADTVRFLYALATGALSGGGIIGAMFAGPIADRIGRRAGQLILAALALIGAVLGGVSGSVYSPELLIGARVITGIATGAATAIAPMYLSESSPLAVRGTLSTFTQMVGSISVLFSQILGLPDFLGTLRLWPMLFFLSALGPVLQIILTLLSPESPRYLCITKGQKLEAIKALKKLRTASAIESGSVDYELVLYEKEAEHARSMPHVKVSHVLFQRKYFWPLSVSLVMQISEHWGGINAIVGYSNILFQRAGVAASQVGYANLSIGTIAIATSIALTILIDRLGRRALHLGGMMGMIVMGIAISAFSILSRVVSDPKSSTFEFFNHANIACVMIFVIFNGIGPVSIPVIIVPELFAQEARGPATSISCFVAWVASTSLFLTFPFIENILNVYVFLPFVVILVVCFVFLFKFLPETKGKSSEEVVALFERY